MIPGYQKGDDITIMNTFYTFPERISDRNWSPDTLTVIYKDNKTGNKKHVTIENPEHEFYLIDEDKMNSYQPFFIDKKDCTKYSVPHNNLEREIAKLTDNENFYKSNIANGARYLNRDLHMDPQVMFSDTNIEDHYRFLFGQEYTNSINKVYKGYFDIEVDGKYQSGDFPEPGECPINCVSYLDEKTNKIYTFILRNPENPLIQEFEDSLGPDLFKELKDFVIEKVGGWKQAKRFNIYDIDFEILFFDDEISLIKSIFDLFHTIDPDFILVWNMSFDMPYIIERCNVLGYDPRKILCNKNFEKLVVKYYIDERNKNELPERTDYCNLSGNITFLDQMIQFSSRRKAKFSSFPNVKLDTIGELVAKVKKLDYHHITDSVIKLPYIDFKVFVFYNIMDVVVQKCIETKTQDVEYVFAKCIQNDTSYRKAHRQTVYLVNRIAQEFYNDGYIICNNCNRKNPKPEEKYAGALVGQPKNTNDYAKIVINGRPSMVADNLLDEDYKSLYPSITIEHNIAPNTLIGAINMPERVYANENYYKNEKYSRSGEYIDNLVCQQIVEFCCRYFHVANIYEFLREDLVEFMNKGYLRPIDRSINNAIYFYPNYVVPKQNAISFNYSPKPFTFFDVKPPMDFTQIREDLRQKAGI